MHTAWFLFLGSTALFVLFADRTHGWSWSRPWPSRPVLAALAAAFVGTIGLVNLPGVQQLLGFASLPWTEQLGIEAYAAAYLVVANLLVISFDRRRPAPRHGRR